MLKKFCHCLMLMLLCAALSWSQSNTISGYVYLDLNTSALPDSGDIFQPAVTVYLYRDMNANGVYDAGDQYVDEDFTDADGKFTFSVSDGSGSVDVRVTSSSNDAEERISNGNMSRSSSDLEFVYDGSNQQIVGMRFMSINIPAGATIASAYIQFTADESDSGPTDLIFYGEDVDDASWFKTTSYDISNRPQTSASVNWGSVPAWTTNNTYNTPDLSTIVQEIVDRAGWADGNDLAFIVEGSGERTAESYDGSSSKAPRLVISYTIANDFVLFVDTNDLSTGFTMTTDNIEVANFTAGGGTDTTNYFGYDGSSVGCFVSDDDDNRLRLVNRFSGKDGIVGDLGVSGVEAIAARIGGVNLYGADANQLGTINRFTGAFTNLSSTFGTGSGSAGSITFSDADGLVFDPYTNILYGAHRRSGNYDVLFQIDTTTGQHVADAFGPGIDYVVITGPGFLYDIDDLAIDPTTGQLYGINNDGGSNDYLVYIDKQTGAGSIISILGVDDMEGLGITNDGLFYGTTGAQGGANSDKFWEIDKYTGTPTLIGTFSSGGDYEACDCILGPVDGFALPVNLIYFTGILAEDEVRLQWQTEIESNNDYFTIEKSTGGIWFDEIARVAGYGTTDQPKTYTLYDPNPTEGINYYRLSQTDLDGKTTFLRIVSVYYKVDRSADFRIYPNPTEGNQINVLLNEDYALKVPVSIYNYMGELVFQNTFDLVNGQNMLSIEVTQSLEPGFYFLGLGDHDDSNLEKFVVK